ncbi:MAG: FAD-dependent oxidoreductase, partial [Actinomycetota bacterium]|nr:FAD-dependent oxidoreductase [Actinomycetota bacterium]
TVVLAAGWDLASVQGLPPGTLPPVRPVKGMTLRLQARALAPRLSQTVRGLVHGIPCYLVPRHDGALVVGATSEERGTDQTVDAGAVYALLRDARSLVPGIDEYELVECATGLRPGTPDNAPVVGWSSVPGLALAAGHYRNGILLAPVTAAAVADLVAGRPLPDVMAPFGPERLLGHARGAPAAGTAAR